MFLEILKKKILEITIKLSFLFSILSSIMPRNMYKLNAKLIRPKKNLLFWRFAILFAFYTCFLTLAEIPSLKNNVGTQPFSLKRKLKINFKKN